ncbi:MAG: response regulator transcription factor, partial [Planctomycetes bacterium]|nr:response regulator transcription factor [Planctomycetota bacterium]
MRILVIEDDPMIGNSLVKGFTEAGHSCDVVMDGAEGLEVAKTQQADVVVLDLMLPNRSGQEILRDLRRQGVLSPVVLVTAISSVNERIECLNAGADDYLVKPFQFAELLARVNAVVRRTSHRPAFVLNVGDVTLDITTRRVTRNGADV